MKSLDQIAAQLQGYDPQALRADAVGEFLARLVEPVTDRERVSLFDAGGRVLADDLISPISVPPHDNSAMDGYAFDGAQLQADAPLDLTVVGTALAGKAWTGRVGPGQCLKIMTGAIMPAGLDTVAPQELTQPATLSTELHFPPGYMRAFAYNLAMEIAPEFGVEPSPQVQRIAMTSKRNLKRINNPYDVMSLPYAIVANRQRFNIYAGNF